MRKFSKLVCSLTAAALLFGMAFTVSAENDEKKVIFDGKKMSEENFTGDEFKGIVPGDTIKLDVTLENTGSKAADWYVRNDLIADALDSVGDNKTGAFEYRLLYEGEPIFENGTLVHADLKEAIQMLEKGERYIYLEKIPAGETRKVSLEVVIDGETQENAYQNTLNKLNLQFAATTDEPKTTTIVEKPTETTTTVTGSGEKKIIKQTVTLGKRLIPRGDAVKTGDEFNVQLFGMLFAASGILLLILGVFSFYKDSRKERE